MPCRARSYLNCFTARGNWPLVRQTNRLISGKWKRTTRQFLNLYMRFMGPGGIWSSALGRDGVRYFAWNRALQPFGQSICRMARADLTVVGPMASVFLTRATLLRILLPLLAAKIILALRLTNALTHVIILSTYIEKKAWAIECVKSIAIAATGIVLIIQLISLIVF